LRKEKRVSSRQKEGRERRDFNRDEEGLEENRREEEEGRNFPPSQNQEVSFNWLRMERIKPEEEISKIYGKELGKKIWHVCQFLSENSLR
jgi:hypothetical protein